MSGIAGIFSLDDSSPTTSAMAAMTVHLERRGPDGTNILIDRHVALGHTLLATTPEALVEVLPLTDSLSGCVITADARLDNRDELMNALGLVEETRTIGDGELILRAYLMWGELCPNELLGDFAFAIWDPRSASLFCARDHIGMRQLIYRHESGHRFVFATEPAALVALPDSVACLNHDRIADFVGNMEGADLTSTFFQDIYRLPPAHILRVDRGGLELSRYWELTAEATLDLPSDQAYAERFHTLFTEAVRCRMRCTKAVGAMVSGGVDSNAVAAVASEILKNESDRQLRTFSAIGPDAPGCVETRAIFSALRSPRFLATTVNHAALGALGVALARDTADSAEPFDAGMVMIRAIYLSAQQAGVNTILDGATGDVVFSSDFHAAALLRRIKLGDAVRTCWGKQPFWSWSGWRALVAAMWQAFVPAPIRAMRFKAGRRPANRRFLERAASLAPFIDLAAAHDRRVSVQRRDFEYCRVDALTRVRALTDPNTVAARERYDRVAASYGIEPRDPFLDLRVIKFCLALPRHQLKRNGWTKWILRHAFVHQLPSEVVWRRGKEHLGTDFLWAVVDNPGQSLSGKPRSPDDKMLKEQYESIYLSNWIAYMRRIGVLSPR